MVNHPNRGRRLSLAANPTPEAVRQARERAKLTEADAAQLVYATDRVWQQWETGERRMHPGLFELFQLKTTEVRHVAFA
ncbi:MAG: hypothetical protein A2X76_01500 [Lysobacterales bacterium GWF1_69_6]|nr:MAG: hypothetical protein A2X76_01500 [Xanthomonadales bacterium GWF1_69_6]